MTFKEQSEKKNRIENFPVFNEIAINYGTKKKSYRTITEGEKPSLTHRTRIIYIIRSRFYLFDTFLSNS